MKILSIFSGKKRVLLLALLLLTFSLYSTLNMNMTGVTAVTSPYIAVDPDSIVDVSWEVGDTFTVDIITDYDGSDVWAWEFTLTYDPSILHGVAVANGDLISVAKSPYATFMPGTFDNTAGKLSLTGAFFFFIPGTTPFTTSGPGTLATVTFEVVGIGSSDITLGKSHPDTTVLKSPDTRIIDASLNPDQIGDGYFSNVLPAVEYDLTIAVEGSGSTVPAVGVHTYPEDEVVSVTATAAGGWELNHWKLDGVPVGSANPYDVTMDDDHALTANFDDHALTANFTEIPGVTYDLTIAVEGSGSTVPAVGVHTYPEDEVVSVTATADVGWTFDGWSGDLTGSDNPDTIIMDGNKTVTATFTETPVEPTIDTLIMLVEDFYDQGDIDNDDIKESLLDKLYAADKMMDRGKTKTAKNILKAFINHLKAQSGKHVKANAANMLIADAEHVISNL